jgi:hypothetical protein
MSNNPNNPIPTPEDLAALDPAVRAEIAAAYLAGLEPGRQPLALFKQMARLAVLSTIEVIPMKDGVSADKPQVLLTQRPQSNDWWSGKWHVPGVVLLPSDQTDPAGNYNYNSPVSRLFDAELKGAVALADEPQILRGRFAGTMPPEGRGRESTLIHWAKVTSVPGVDLPANARFFDAHEVVESPPEGGFIEYHDQQVKDATAAYVARYA